MKILLVGEYSRLHNSLKEGLIALGHDVSIVGCGDQFKKFPVDYSIYSRICNDHKIVNIIFRGIRRIFGLDIEKIEKAIRFYLLLPNFDNYHHVQLINSDALETYPILSRFLFKKLFKKIKNRSLLICGDEVPIVDFWFQKELKYSVLTPYFEDNSLKKHFQFPLKYKKNNYRKTFNLLKDNCQKLITSDLDYEIPMQKTGFSTKFIPNPINTDLISFNSDKNIDKIIIFLGINQLNYNKKGIIYFEKALRIIQKNHADKVEIIVTKNLPYNEYITVYNTAHIVLDQVFAYDQGYNALEAMAKGKVVFTGAETEFLNQYQLQEDEVCINALPDENEIAIKLSILIEHPEKIIEISKNARHFVEKEHNYKIIAMKYLDCWFKE